MVRRCSDKVAKLMLVIFNSLFLICGIALLTIGFFDFKNANSVNSIITGLNSLNVAVLVVGAVIVIISFLGCCGALKENSCMLNTFIGLLAIILIAEIAVGYLAFSNSHEIKSMVSKNARDSISKQSNSTLLKEAWDDVQLTLQCCGADNYKDYLNDGLEIPDSCCKQKHTEKCGPNVAGFSNDGCVGKIEYFLKKHYLSIGVTAIIFAFIEIAGFTFACCLRSAINERYETV